MWFKICELEVLRFVTLKDGDSVTLSVFFRSRYSKHNKKLDIIY